jgi:hypothetical protein
MFRTTGAEHERLRYGLVVLAPEDWGRAVRGPWRIMGEKKFEPPRGKTNRGAATPDMTTGTGVGDSRIPNISSNIFPASPIRAGAGVTRVLEGGRHVHLTSTAGLICRAVRADMVRAQTCSPGSSQNAAGHVKGEGRALAGSPAQLGESCLMIVRPLPCEGRGKRGSAALRVATDCSYPQV